MTWILKVARYSEITAAGFGISTNLLLFYLITTVNKANIKQTSRVLLQNCFLDLLLSVATLLSGFQMVNINKVTYFIFGSHLQFLGFEFASIFTGFFVVCIMLSVMAMPVPFYIRYMALCRNRNASKKNISIAYGLVFLCVMEIIVFMAINYPPYPEAYEKFIPPTLTDFWLDEYPKGVFFIARDVDYKLLVHLAYVFVITFISYSLVIFFSVKISRHLGIHIRGFKQTKIINRQLHLTLIIQAIGPVVTGNIPIFLLIVMMISGYENHYIAVGLSSLLGWVAVVNPIAAMIILTPYRKRIKEILGHNEKSATFTVSVVTQS